MGIRALTGDTNSGEGVSVLDRDGVRVGIGAGSAKQLVIDSSSAGMTSNARCRRARPVMPKA
jgi:hypothetical protein